MRLRGMSLGHIGLMLALGACAFFTAARTPNTGSEVAAKSSSPRDPMLQRVDMDDMTYAQAIEFLGTLTGGKVIVDWHTLKDREVTRDTPLHIHLHASNVSIGDVLNAVVMSHVGGYDQYQAPGFRCTGDVIVFAEINTDDEQAPSVIQAYDVGSLVSNVGMRFTEWDPGSASQHNSRAAFERLGDIVQHLSTWGWKQGPAGRCFAVGDTLFIFDTPTMQEEIAGILHKLWRIRSGELLPDEP